MYVCTDAFLFLVPKLARIIPAEAMKAPIMQTGLLPEHMSYQLNISHSPQ